MHEVPGHAIGAVRLYGFPALVVRGADDRRAEPFDGADLRVGRRVHDHHRAARAGFARGQRDPLRGVAGAHGPDAVLQLCGRQLPHDVVRAANLERADRLQRFELQIEIRLELDERRANRRIVDSRRRVADRSQGDVSVGHAGGQDGKIVPAEPPSVNGGTRNLRLSHKCRGKIRSRKLATETQRH